LPFEEVLPTRRSGAHGDLPGHDRASDVDQLLLAGAGRHEAANDIAVPPSDGHPDAVVPDDTVDPAEVNGRAVEGGRVGWELVVDLGGRPRIRAGRVTVHRH